MKYYFSCIIAIFFFIKAQSQENVEIVLDHTHHDFGTILEKNGITVCTLQIQNLSKETISLTNIESSCACTNVDWNTQDIKSQGKTTLLVYYNPFDRPGSFKQYINLVFNTPYGLYSKEYYIEGEVIARQESWEKIYAYHIDSLCTNELKLRFTLLQRDTTLKVPLYNMSRDTQRIALYPNPYATASLVLPPLTQDTLTLRWQKNDSLGHFICPLYLMANNKKLDPPLTAYAHHKEDFSTLSYKDRLHAPLLTISSRKQPLKLKQNKVKRTKFSIKNIGENPLIIRKFEPINKYITLYSNALIINSNKQKDIPFTIDTHGLPKGHYTGFVTIISNDPLHAESKVPINFEVY